MLEKELAAEGGSKSYLINDTFTAADIAVGYGITFFKITQARSAASAAVPRRPTTSTGCAASSAVCQPSAFSVLAAHGVRGAMQLPAYMHARFDSSVACCRLPRQCPPDRH